VSDENGPYPEHSKLRVVKERSQVIGGFLHWLREERKPALYLFTWINGEPDMAGISAEALLAEYFGIDLAKLSEEKDRMLDEQRRLNRIPCED
jgi:hypothetical protein